MLPDKTCLTCGRRIQWRKKWQKDWEDVRYCSKRCRTAKPRETEHELEDCILSLLDKVSAKSSICPSEAARAHFPADEWREHMEETRQAARRLVAQGKIQILQKGSPVDPSSAKGPIRLRRKKD